MKKIVVLMSMLLILLAACGSEDPTPVPEPTAVSPAAEPTAPPPVVEEVAPATSAPDPTLTQKNWQWERREQNGTVLFEVNAEQGEYLLFFNNDSTFSVGLDCNYGNGNYTTASNGTMLMELVPMTMADCETNSFGDEMMEILDETKRYAFEEDGAVLIISAAYGDTSDYYRDLASAPTESVGGPLEAMEHVPDPSLINKLWTWESRSPNGNAIDEIIVPNPSDYTIFFTEDGSFIAKMDCRYAEGLYATEGNAKIFMEPSPSAAMVCGEGSLDTSMEQTFGPAQNYTFENDGTILVLKWVAGGPIDYYRSVAVTDMPAPSGDGATGTVTAPDGVFLRTGPGTHYPYIGAAPYDASGDIIGVSQDGLWWLVATPSLEAGEAWVVGEFVDAINTENVPVVMAAPVQDSLTGTPWLWVSTTDAAVGEQPVADYTNYVILFNEDGTANIKADCNNSLADYTTDGSNINITPGPTTMVHCGDSSQSAEFLEKLAVAAIYFIDGGNLYLDLPADSGTMRFVPEGLAVPPTEDAPAGEADGSTLYLVSLGPVGAPLPLVAGSQITANFAGDQITGNSGCNNYSGTMVPVETYFNVTNITTTRMMCAEDVMAQELAYLAGLQAISGYQWEEQLIGSDSVVTSGQILYAMPDGAVGVMNFTSSP